MRILFTAKNPAVLETRIRVGEGATLEYFPDHVIPHGASALRQFLRIEMGRGSRAIVLDSWRARATRPTASAEQPPRWVAERIEVYACSKPAYVNRTRIAPAERNPQQHGSMQNFDYISCMAVIADGFTNWKEICLSANEILNSVPEILGGASALSRGGCVIRLLAHSASAMTLANQKLWDMARQQLTGLPHSAGNECAK